MPKSDPNAVADNSLGESFREARIATGLTQRALAALTNLRHEAIARIETGERAPNAAQAAAIARALKAPHLMDGIPDPEAAEQLRRSRISAGKRGKPRPDAAERMQRLHAEKRAEAEKAKGELLDADELAKAHGRITAVTVRARASAGKLDPVRLPGIETLKGQPRIFFSPDSDWPARGTHPDSLRALFSTHVGRIRQRALGKLLGRQYGHLGGRERGYTDAQAVEVQDQGRAS